MGANPNLVFYAWRLHKTYSVDVTVVNPNIPADPKGLSFISSSLGNESFNPYAVHSSLADVAAGSQRPVFDIILVSASNLQGFQSLMDDLNRFISPKESLIIVELSGFINLEPFITANSNPRNPLQHVHVCSIMNDSDIKQLTSDYTTFRHQSLSHDNRIYIGTCTADSKLDSFTNFHRIVKLFQMVQHDSLDKISVLKTLKPKEFMTYQWKLALPRVIFNPLLVIFEIEYPEDFSQQILCKPLISGLVNELFKVIKKMDCKLVKGFENEANLLKNWSESYPRKSSNPDFIHSNQMFYDYYHGKTDELNIDVLLLQPILLADDNLIRTPYLENLYSMLCQLVKVNNGNSESIFFARKNNPASQLQSTNNAALYKEQEEDSKRKLSQMDVRLNVLSNDVKQLEGSKMLLEQYLSSKSNAKVQLENDIAGLSNQLSTLQVQISESQLMLNKQEQQHIQQKALLQQQETQLQQVQEQRRLAEQNTQPKAVKGAPNRDSVLQREKLADLTDIALYGEHINNSTEKVLPTPKINNNQMPGREAYETNGTNGNMSNGHVGESAGGNLSERELELERREKSLMNREMALQQQQQYQSTQRIPTLFNNYNAGNGHANNGMADQQPPHGLPANGMPSNAFPPNLRSGSLSSAVPHIQQQQQQQQVPPQQMQQPMTGAQRQAHGGSPNEMNGARGYPPQMQQQQLQPQNQYNYNQSGSRMNSMTSQYFEPYAGNANGQGSYYGQPPLFQNAAPIDPLLEQRFKQNPKKLNRRSQYPQLSQGNMDGLDMGGRGGMPMPMTGMGNKRASVGNALAVQGHVPNGGNGHGAGGANGYAPSGPRRVSSAGNLLPVQASYNQPAHSLNNLVVPQRHAPQQQQQQNQHQQSLQQQQQLLLLQGQSQQQFKASPNMNGADYSNGPDANAKPLGGISSSSNPHHEPKKKGFFGRKK